MLKRLFTNRKWLISIVVVLVLVGTLIVVFTTKDSKEGGKSDINIETDKNREDGVSEDNSDKVQSGEGLEVEDVLDESAYTIDGSGDWEESSEGESNTNNASTDDKQSDKTQSDDTQSDGTQTDDTQSDEPENEDSDDKLDKDILVDDKVWGEIS